MNDGGPHPSIQPPPAHLAGQQQALAGGRSSPYPAGGNAGGLPPSAASSSSSAGGPPSAPLPNPYGPPPTHYQQQQQQAGGWGGQHPQQQPAHPHHPQQQQQHQQHYYPSQQPPPPLAHPSDPYGHHGSSGGGSGGGGPPGLQGFTSQPPPRAPAAGSGNSGGQPPVQLVRNVQTRGGGQQQQHAHHHQQQQQQQGTLSHSPSPYHEQNQQQQQLSPALGGWQGPAGGQGGYHPQHQQQQQQQHYPWANQGYGPPPGQQHPHPHHPLHQPHQQQQQLGGQGYPLDLKPNVGITPPSSTPGPPPRPDSAASSRPGPAASSGGGGGGGAGRPARTAAAEKRAAATAAKAASGGGKAGKGNAQGSDDDDADEAGSTTGGGGGAPTGGGRKGGNAPAGGNGPSDFVKKLFKMLGDEEYADVVAWSAAQDSFIVKDMNEFTTRILPQTFRHSNFASFVRQLNKYDFHKVKAEEGGHVETTWEFKHPQFNSRSGSELDLIKRKIPVPKKAGGGGAGGAAGSAIPSGVGALAKEPAQSSTPLTTTVPLVSNGNGGFVPLEQGPPGSAGTVGPLGPAGGLGPPPLHLQPHQQQQQHPHHLHNGSRLSVPPPSATSAHFSGGPPHSPSMSGQPSPYGPSSYPPHHPSSHPQAAYGGPPPAASNPASAGAIHTLQEQVRELQAGHAAMFQHVQTLHSKYQKIIGDLVALQRSSTSTEALVGDVVNYLVQMENEQRVSNETFTPASTSSDPSTTAASTSFRPSYGVSPLPSDPIESGGAAVSPTSLGRFPEVDDAEKGKARENGLVGASGMDVDVPQGWEPAPVGDVSSGSGNGASSGPPSSNGPSLGISASLIDPSLRGSNDAESYPHPTNEGGPGGDGGGSNSNATAPFGLSETLFAEFVPGGSFSAESITGTKRGLGETGTPGAGDADDDADEGGGKRFRSDL